MLRVARHFGLCSGSPNRGCVTTPHAPRWSWLPIINRNTASSSWRAGRITYRSAGRCGYGSEYGSTFPGWRLWPFPGRKRKRLRLDDPGPYMGNFNALASHRRKGRDSNPRNPSGV